MCANVSVDGFSLKVGVFKDGDGWLRLEQAIREVEVDHAGWGRRMVSRRAAERTLVLGWLGVPRLPMR